MSPLFFDAHTLTKLRHLLESYQNDHPQQIVDKFNKLPSLAQSKIREITESMRYQMQLAQPFRGMTVSYYPKPFEIANSIYIFAMNTLHSIPRPIREIVQNEFIRQQHIYRNGDIEFRNIEDPFMLNLTLRSIEKAAIHIELEQFNTQNPYESGSQLRNIVLIFLADEDAGLLDLSGLDLSEIPNIFNLTPLNTKITTLDLSCNNLRTLPSSIQELSNLTSINISMNPMTELPSVLYYTPSLNSIEATNTLIEELPSELMASTSIKFIDISFSQHLKAIDPSLSDIKINAFGCPNFISIVPELLNTSFQTSISENLRFTIESLERAEIKQIILEWAKTEENGEQVATHFVEFLDNTYATDLELNSKELKTLPPIFTFITLQQRLRSLNLDNNPIEQLPLGLDSCIKLTKLSLLNNRMRFFSKQLLDLPQDCSLYFSTPYISNKTLYNIAKTHHRQKTTSKSLECLQKSEVKMEIKAWASMQGAGGLRAEECFNAFLDHSYIEEIEISNLELTSLPDCFDTIAFKERCKVFNASGNHIEKLPLSFMKMQKLQMLDLSYNRLISQPHGLNKSNFPNIELLRTNNNPYEYLFNTTNLAEGRPSQLEKNLLWHPSYKSSNWH